LIVGRTITRLEYNNSETTFPVSDPKTWALFAACIQNYIPLKICSMVMGINNPLPGPNKCCIEYISNGIAKIREVEENGIMDFSWDIIEVKYGVLSGKYLSSDYYQTFPALGKYLLDTLLALGTFTISNDHFLKSPADDPAPGTGKQVSIQVVHVRQPGRWRVPDPNHPGQWQLLGSYYAWTESANNNEGNASQWVGDPGRT
jgi:hypothetical protein